MINIHQIFCWYIVLIEEKLYKFDLNKRATIAINKYFIILCYSL